MNDYIGKQFGNYTIIKQLGQGGFAGVYLGEHIHLGTNAAIKVLHTRLAEQDVTSFHNEARTIAQLVHPNIVRILDFDIENGIPYLVLDYAPGGTLRQLHPRGSKLALSTTIAYVKQVASALQYAHNLKIVHRDVKPENILVGRGNEVLLSDFGIAIIAQNSRYEEALDTAGTISYMAPEQLQGRPQPASDQYALGIVAYEWLCGERPFTGTFIEIAAMQSTAQPPPLHNFMQIPPQIEQVIHKTLRKEPSQRFANVTEFAAALENAYKAALDGRPLQASTTLSTEITVPSAITQPTQSRRPPLASALESQQTVRPASSIPGQPGYLLHALSAAPTTPLLQPAGYSSNPSQPEPRKPSYLPLLQDYTQKENILLIVLCNLISLFLLTPALYEITNYHTAGILVYTIAWFLLIEPLYILLAGILLGGWRGMLATPLPIILIITLFMLGGTNNLSLSHSIFMLLGLPFAALVTGLLSKRLHARGWKTIWTILPGSFIISIAYLVIVSFGSRTSNIASAIFGLIAILLLYTAVLTAFAALLEMLTQKLAEKVQKRRIASKTR